MDGLNALGLDDGLTNALAQDLLFQKNVSYVPIRHHSPACSWMLRNLLRQVKPDVVLIEAPADLQHLIPLMAEPDVQFPVALMALGKRQDVQHNQPSVYYPFSDHSPETIALQEAKTLGAQAIFIDLPTQAELKDEAQNGQDEQAFTTADFIRQACRHLGLRDGNELWDHLFEVRLGDTDWRGFFADVYAYCAGMRGSQNLGMDAARNTQREDMMRSHIAQHSGKNIVVVTGGFHTPALLNPGKQKKPKEPPQPESYLIAYSEQSLDEVSGYGAGLAFPSWYSAAWQAALAADGMPDWEALILDRIEDFAKSAADENRRIAVPQLVEMTSLAQQLAQFRGRTPVLLNDLRDAMRTALIKTEVGPGEPYSALLANSLRGHKMGQAPKAAGFPPILKDARGRATAARIALDTTERRAKKLDIQRNAGHLKTSRFLHQMVILGTNCAHLTGGPDFRTGHRIDLLFEEWEAGWSPFVEGILVEHARLGTTVPNAAMSMLTTKAQALRDGNDAQDISAWWMLILDALQAGLPAFADDTIAELSDLIAKTQDHLALSKIIQASLAILTPHHPFHSPELTQCATAAFNRLLDLIPAMAELPDEAATQAVAAIRTVAAVVLSDRQTRFDADFFHAALSELHEQPDCPPVLQGGVLATLVQGGFTPPAALATALSGTLNGVTQTSTDRIGVLQGILQAAPKTLWQERSVLETANAAITALDDDEFMHLLPGLRHTMTGLNPHETDRMAEELAILLGTSPTALTQTSQFTEEEVQAALALNKKLENVLQADGILEASDA